MSLRKRAVVIAVIAAGLMGLVLLSAVFLAGNGLRSRNPLTAITHEKAEEFLSEIFGQTVQIERVSFLSFNRVLLENIASTQPFSDNKEETEASERSGGERSLSLYIARISVGFDLWQYLWGRKISSLTVEIYRPEIEIKGSLPPLLAGKEGRASSVLGYDGVELIIDDGRLTYTDGGLRRPIALESISGTLFLGIDGGTCQGSGVEVEHLQFDWENHRLSLQGEVISDTETGGEVNVALLLSTGSSSLMVTGRFDGGEAGHLDLSLVGENLDLAQLLSLLDPMLQGLAPGIAASLESLGGTIDAHWRITGQKQRFSWEGDFDISQLTHKGVLLGQLGGAVSFDGQMLQFPMFRGEILGSRISGRGVAAAGPVADYDVHLTLEGIKPTGIATITKAWDLPLPAAAFQHWEDLDVEIHLHPGDNPSQLEADWQAARAGEAASGTVSINPDGSCRGSIRCKIDSLQDFVGHFGTSVGSIEGKLEADIRFSGSSRGLQGEGSFAITEAEAWGSAFSGKAEVALQDRELRVKSLVLEKADGGAITAAGTVSLKNPLEPIIELSGKVSEVAYSSGPLAGKLQGDISLIGTWPHPVLRGRLCLQKGSLDLSKLGSTGDLTSSDLVPLNLPLAVDVEVADSLKVTGMGMVDLTALGALHISGSARDPHFQGRMEIEAGRIVYLGTPFRIVEGWAEFSPYQGFVPNVYLEGAGEVMGHSVTLILQGPADHMDPTLVSDAGFSQDELLSMLGIPHAVNTVLDDGLAAAIQREMGRLLGGQLELHLLGNLERQLEAALGLDEFQLEPGLGGGKVKLELGKYISEGIFLGYTQTVYPQWEYEWRVDYKLSENLRLNTTWNGDDEYKLGLEMRIAF